MEFTYVVNLGHIFMELKEIGSDERNSILKKFRKEINDNDFPSWKDFKSMEDVYLKAYYYEVLRQTLLSSKNDNMYENVVGKELIDSSILYYNILKYATYNEK